MNNEKINELLKYIRKTHLLFSISNFWQKPLSPIINENELEEIPIEYKIYKARLKSNAPSIFILDRNGYITPAKPETPLIEIKEEDLSVILSQIPKSRKLKLIKVLREEWGFPLKDKETDKLIEAIKLNKIFYTPVPLLKDISFLEKINWREFIEYLVEPKEGKDEKLKTIHKAKLIKPIFMKYAPNSIEITNSGTGKTSFYNACGIVIDKATPKSVLGFAKSPEEIYVGTINETELPTAFDQIESQTATQLARYMYNILETGEALVDSGGVRFPIKTYSSFAYLGNPIAKNEKIAESFKALIDHISYNPAIGRRFSIILFSTNLKTIQNKMTIQEEEEWKNAFTIFRAIEEYASENILKILRDQKVLEWLHKPIPGYREAIYKATETLKDIDLANFFIAHSEAQHRVRASALYSAIALLLDKIALNKFSIEEIIEEAEELLNDFIEINLESIKELSQQYEELRIESAKTYFENLPDYLKEIVSAILLYRKEKPNEVKIKLETIPYDPENKEAYPYFSKCIDLLKRRKKLENLNRKLRDYFGFQIIKIDNNFEVEFFETPKPPEDLKLIGSFRNFVDFVNSSFLQTDIFKEDKEKGVSENITKLRKLRNDENQDEDYLIFSGKLKIENEGNLKKYICNICGFQVLNFEDFKKHLKIHGEK